jgi:alkyl sulfatase BDS1-like metallo-beta-lactamase superfamily hydrolase
MPRLRVLCALLLLAFPAALFAVDLTPPPANPLLVNHLNWFDPPQVWNIQTDAKLSRYRPPGLKYTAYSAVGFDLANTLLLIGPTGEIVIIDTLGDETSVENAVAAFQAAGILEPDAKDKFPIRAIIYTHNHIDHIGGVHTYLRDARMPPCPIEKAANAGKDGFFDADAKPCVAILGQEKIIQGVNNTATVIGTMINNRSGYMYGSFLPPSWVVTNGIGKRVNPGTAAWRAPSRTFSQKLAVRAGGMNLQLVYVPSETDDELMVFVADKENGGKGPGGMLFSAEVIQGPSFPNLYSLRGTSYRNPATWYRSVDVLRTYDSWCMMPSHGTPLCGRENIQTLLRNFRDAIQYTHDQSVRYMNKGYTMQQLPELIKMPQYLIDDLEVVEPAKPKNETDPKDYLRFFYGSVPQAVRELYFGYLGWYQADPVGLAPLPEAESSTRLIELMGGRAKVLETAQGAYDKGDFQWSAELTAMLVHASPSDPEARELKAKAYDKLAEPQTNPNWRNFYLTAANELRGRTPKKAIAGGLTSPGIVDALPYETWVSQWTLRLQAERTISENVTLSLGFVFTTVDGTAKEAYAVKIRRGVAELFEHVTPEEAKKSDAAIQMGKAAESKLIYADNAGSTDPFLNVLNDLIAKGDIKVVAGNAETVTRFFGYFDPAPQTYPPLAGR